MSTIRANTITDTAGTGAPTFSNGIKTNAILDASGGNTATINGKIPIAIGDVPAAGGMTLLGTLATTSGTTVTLSGLNLTSYKFVVAVLKTVSATLDAGVGLQGNGSNAGINIFVTTGVTANGINGVLQIDLTTGVFSATSHTATIASPASGVATSYSGNQTVVGTATTSIGFALGGGTFDAGSITIYGVK